LGLVAATGALTAGAGAGATFLVLAAGAVFFGYSFFAGTTTGLV